MELINALIRVVNRTVARSAEKRVIRRENCLLPKYIMVFLKSSLSGEDDLDYHNNDLIKDYFKFLPAKKNI